MAPRAKNIWPADSELAPTWCYSPSCEVDRNAVDHSVHELSSGLRAPGTLDQSRLSDYRSVRHWFYLQSPINYLSVVITLQGDLGITAFPPLYPRPG